jgi:hypothetical protein
VTSKILLTALAGTGIATFLALMSFLLVLFGPINYKNGKRYSVFAASLSSVSLLWLIQRSHLALGNSIFDMFALLLILWFFCLFLFWAGVVKGLKFTGQHHDFGESSILSMQYMDSRMVAPNPVHNEQDQDFALTQQQGDGNPLMSTKGMHPHQSTQTPKMPT